MAVGRSRRGCTDGSDGLRALQAFVRIPSVSSQPRQADDVRRCAEWLANHVRQIGLEHVRVIPTARHPFVYADWLHAPGRPTLLIYGHYDVQPVEPLAAWTSPPFAAEIRGDYLYGRGASDDKGQLFAHVKAIERFLRSGGRLPVNVRCVFDGEEEIGSPGLTTFLSRDPGALRADVAVVSDTRMLGPDRPALTYGLRGGLGLELEVTGPAAELHAGTFGGAVHNPLQALCELVAGLHRPDGRVAIPGFYDRVRIVPAGERAMLAAAGPRDERLLRDARAPAGWGEPGYSLFERTTIRPALTINGIAGGHAGPGRHAVIPPRAVAKLSFRLVPDQDPRDIEALLRRHLNRAAPPTVRVCLRSDFAARPVLLDRRHPALRAAASAYRHGFGAAPVYLRSGGTIPIVGFLAERLGIPTVLMGFALPGDNAHAPNERFHLPTFFRAIETCSAFLIALGTSLTRRVVPEPSRARATPTPGGSRPTVSVERRR